MWRGDFVLCTPIHSKGFCPGAGEFVRGIISKKKSYVRGLCLGRILLCNSPKKFQANPSVILLTNFLPYLAMMKNPKIQSCDLDLWHTSLKFNRILEILEMLLRYMCVQNFIELSAAVMSYRVNRKQNIWISRECFSLIEKNRTTFRPISQ